MSCHDDVIKWKHFPRNWPFMRGIHRSPMNSPHKGQWRGALMFPLICAWIHGWVNNRKAGDLRRYRTHYDVTVMINAPPPPPPGWGMHLSPVDFLSQISCNPKSICMTWNHTDRWRWILKCFLFYTLYNCELCWCLLQCFRYIIWYVSWYNLIIPFCFLLLQICHQLFII